MDFITQYVSMETLAIIVGAVLALQATAIAVTKMTPSPRDDQYVAIFYRVMFKLAAMVGVKHPK